jgi:hypothetical protein
MKGRLGGGLFAQYLLDLCFVKVATYNHTFFVDKYGGWDS